jgi:hypothetical protein
MKHGGRIPRNAGQDKRECIFYPAGVSPILPARFERILVHFICDFPLDKLAHRLKYLWLIAHGLGLDPTKTLSHQNLFVEKGYPRML